MYSAVFLGCPTTSIRPNRETSTPTWSMEVARTTSAACFCSGVSSTRGSRLSRRAAAYSANSALRRLDVSRSGSKELSSRLSVAPMSAEEIREVSSWTVSIPDLVTMRSAIVSCPLRLPLIRTRVAMSSSM